MKENVNFYKILLVGDSAVGKTSLLKLYTLNEVSL